MRVTREAELAEAIAGATGPLKVQGGGTRDIGRPVTGELLEVGLSGVELYEPGALTLVVQAGTPIAEIETLLAGEGQRLAFEPMDHRALLGTTGVPTIGGVVAANVSGPRRIQAGAARDFALGARFVDGTGRIVKNGGRVMKNVTGYDLVKLLAGSWGTLGVLTEVSLKVLPIPETEATLTLSGLDEVRAVEAMAAALGSPWDVTGAAHGVLGPDAKTQLRIEGSEASVAYRAQRLTDHLAPFGPVALEADPARSREIWRRLRDVEPFADRPFVARVSLKPTDLAEMLYAFGQVFFDPETRAPLCDVSVDWGGGLAWIAAREDQLVEAAKVSPEAGADPAALGARLMFASLQSHFEAVSGHATLVKAPLATRAEVSVFQPQPAPLATIARGLKQKFDPRGILNPGLMGA